VETTGSGDEEVFEEDTTAEDMTDEHVQEEIQVKLRNR